MYGRLRGVPEESLVPLVERTLDKLSLHSYADFYSSELRWARSQVGQRSGGPEVRWVSLMVNSIRESSGGSEVRWVSIMVNSIRESSDGSGSWEFLMIRAQLR